MNKQTVLAAVAVLAVAGSAFAGQMTQPPAAQQAPATQAAPQAPRPPASPAGSAATQVAGKWVEPQPGAAPRYRDGKWIVVDYGRPILRGRGDVFGKGADYGKTVNAGAPVWRAGANVTTRLKAEVPLIFGDKTLAAGEYSLFVELKEGAWTLILSAQPFQQKYDANNKTDTWGSYNYDAKFDVARVPMKVMTSTVTVEQFTIGFVNMTQQNGSLAIWWDKTMATVDFKVAQ
jgi:hypothetical protein